MKLSNGAPTSPSRREVEQAQEGLVPGHETQVAVDQGESLVDQVERRAQRFVAAEPVVCVWARVGHGGQDGARLFVQEQF
jgi:hypothetical protein